MTRPPLTLAQEQASKSLLDYVADGGEIGFLIILLSVAAVALTVTQLVRLRLSRLAPPESVARLDELLAAADVDAAVAHCRDDAHRSFLTRVVGPALERCARSRFGLLELRSALEETGQREVARLHRSVEAVGVIAAVAPMLGLLGTVVGMVGAFDTITLSDGPARPDQLAGNISQALVTTVLGLVVAIPCTAAYTYLRSRIDSLTSELAETIEDLAAHLESSAHPGGPTP